MKKLCLLTVLLFLVNGCTSIQTKWNTTRATNTIEAYEDFLRQYPKSEFSSEARLLLEQLCYKQAKSKNTIEAYEDFIKRFPDGKFAGEARLLLEPLCFKNTKSQNTILAHREFLKKFPDSKFYDEVKHSLKTLLDEYAKSIKELRISIMETERNISYKDKALLIKAVLTDYLTSSGYSVKESDTPNELVLYYDEIRCFSGTSISYWHPTIKYTLVLTLNSKPYGELFKNSYSESRIDTTKRSTFSDVSVIPLDPFKPTYIGGEGMWGTGIKFGMPSRTQGLTLAQGIKSYNWDGLYSFEKFKADLPNALENKSPLQVQKDTEVSY